MDTDDALRLRNYAVHPEDSLLTLEEIAHHILEHEDRNPRRLKDRSSALPPDLYFPGCCTQACGLRTLTKRRPVSRSPM